jgi:hypothetical protein
MPFKGKLQMKTPSVRVEHLDLLHPERLTASSFEAAVAAFGNTIVGSGSSLDGILQTLLSGPLHLEIVLSGK